MDKLLFLFLRMIKFFRRGWYKITGRKEEDISAERIVSGKSWEEFCDKLKAAGASLMFPGTPGDAFNQAEGIRYLTRLIRGGLEAFIEFNDPAFPVLRRTAHETIKLGADNPDNIYLNAQISGKYEYVIRGKRNTINYLGFFTQNGGYGSTGGLAPCGYLDSNQLITSPDGSFEIILSHERKGKNWLKTDPETTMLMVRQTFFDRSSEIPADVQVFNLDGRKHPDYVTPEAIDKGLAQAAMFVGGASFLFAKWANGFQKHVNQLPMFDPETSNAAGGDAGIIYYHSYWRLETDEALVIRVKPPQCESWNFQLNNYWMESLDYRYYNICINKAAAVMDDDGSVTVVVASRNKNFKNHIETAGHTEGTMLWRWYRLAPGELPVQPECKVIRLEE